MGKKVFAAYCRTAVADDSAIEKQKQALSQYAKENGNGEEIVFYVDNGHAGTSTDRPAFQKLNQDIADGKIGTIVVFNITRLSRDYTMLHEWLADLHRKKVLLMIVSVGSDFWETYRD